MAYTDIWSHGGHWYTDKYKKQQVVVICFVCYD